ncbi:MAG: ISAs1 family transposase [Planctomycetales bacterium]|nr:ISAs1 family transposase [Planctomycetales bacterium]
MCWSVEREQLPEVGRHFEGLEEPRSSVNWHHPLVSVMVLSLMGFLAGASGPTVIAEWAYLNRVRLLLVLDWPHGVPCKNIFRRVLSVLNPGTFQACFVSWLQTMQTRAAVATGMTQPIYAIDGTTLRRSHDRSKGLGSLHSVSLWAADFGLTLGQVATAEKPNALFRNGAAITSRVWLGSALRGPQRSGIHPNLGAAKRRPQPHKF